MEGEILLLSKLPQDLDVVISGYEDGVEDVDVVHIGRAR